MRTSSRTTRQRNQNTPSTTKSRKRKAHSAIVENVFFPVRVVGCEEGQTTAKGTHTISFELQNIVNKAIFKTIVFEDVAPHYIDRQIIDIILPEDIQDYELEDLMDGGFSVKLKFNTKNDITYMNIVDVMSIDEQHEELLQQILREEQQEKLKSQKEIKEAVNDLQEMFDYDPFSHSSEKKEAEPYDEENDDYFDLTKEDSTIDDGGDDLDLELTAEELAFLDEED